MWTAREIIADLVMLNNTHATGSRAATAAMHDKEMAKIEWLWAPVQRMLDFSFSRSAS